MSVGLTVEQRYYERGYSIAREDICNRIACRVENINENVVLQRLGLDYSGAEARAILRDSAERTARNGEHFDGSNLLEIARAAALRGYREALRAV